MSRWEGIPALLPLAWVYGGAVSMVRGARTVPAPAATTPRVISVGNLEVGGSGKTPLCMLLLESATGAGKRVAYVSRGFGSEAERGPLVTVVLGENGDAPASFAGLRVVRRDGGDLARSIGDEGAMVARRIPAAALVMARDKRRAVAVATQLDAEIVVCDDAFQSFALARHLDVLLLDAERPLANGYLLPAGRLREAPSAIGRAQVLVFNGASDAGAVARAREKVTHHIRGDARVYGLRRRVSLEPVTGAANKTPPSDVVAVCAIARPDRFRDSVEQAGVPVATTIAFRDHHRYDAADVARIHAHSRARAIVTTEKDWVKLGRFDWRGFDVWIATLEVELVGDSDVAGWLFG